MNIVLDDVITAGEVSLAAVTEHSTKTFYTSAGLMVNCIKRPVGIFIRVNNVTSAFKVGGQYMGSEDFKRHYRAQYIEFNNRLESQ